MNQYELQSALQRYVVDARQKLETMDWLVQGVGGSDAAPSFSYSVGLSTKFGHLEIAIVGFDPDLCRSIINEAGELVRNHGADFRSPVLSGGIARNYDVAFRPVSSASSREKCKTGRAILDVADYPLVQLFFRTRTASFLGKDAATGASERFSRASSSTRTDCRRSMRSRRLTSRRPERMLIEEVEGRRATNGSKPHARPPRRREKIGSALRS